MRSFKFRKFSTLIWWWKSLNRATTPWPTDPGGVDGGRVCRPAPHALRLGDTLLFILLFCLLPLSEK